MSCIVLADTHAHYHRCFDREQFLQAALVNFKKAGDALKCSDPIKLICLTEKPGDDFFDALSVGGAIEQLCATCKQIKFPSGELIYVVAGQQVYSSEGLELLALNTERRFESRLPFAESIKQAVDCGATVVINWCFGKWWGERGKVLRDVMRSPHLQKCFLGDVPLRFSQQLDSVLLKELREVCSGVLSGSDPLPFKAEVVKPGSFGSFGDFSEQPDLSSTEGIGSLLMKLGAEQKSFGSRDSILTFLGRQCLNQIHRV